MVQLSTPMPEIAIDRVRDLRMFIKLTPNEMRRGHYEKRYELKSPDKSTIEFHLISIWP
jgi:hypothetical protein